MVAGEGKNKTVREKSPSKDYPALSKKRRRGGEILEGLSAHSGVHAAPPPIWFSPQIAA